MSASWVMRNIGTARKVLTVESDSGQLPFGLCPFCGVEPKAWEHHIRWHHESGIDPVPAVLWAQGARWKSEAIQAAIDGFYMNADGDPQIGDVFNDNGALFFVKDSHDPYTDALSLQGSISRGRILMARSATRYVEGSA